MVVIQDARFHGNVDLSSSPTSCYEIPRPSRGRRGKACQPSAFVPLLLEEELAAYQPPMRCFFGEGSTLLSSNKSTRWARSSLGVSIFPNGRRQLERMGLQEALAQVGAKVGDGSEYYRMDGTVVGRILTADLDGWNGGVWNAPGRSLSRVLAEALPRTAIRTARRCIGFEQNADVAQLKFANGTTAEADVVIGADGIQSVLQKYVVQPSIPEYSGSRAYRGLIPSEMLPEWRTEAHQIWMGDGKHFMVYPRSEWLAFKLRRLRSDERRNS